MKRHRIWTVVCKKVSIFCGSCTLHGFQYVGAAGWPRVLWATAITASVVLCALLSQMIWDKFAEDPTFTVVQTVHHSTEEVPFPAVAVCDSMVYGPAAENITSILTLRGFSATQIDDFYRSLTRVKSREYKAEEHVVRMHNVLEALDISYDELLYQVHKPCGEVLRECLWRAVVYECSRMFRHVLTMYGHCCQFDIDYFKQSVDNDTNFRSGVQKTEALDFIVNTKRFHHNGSITDGRAALYIFDSTNRLTLLDSSVTLTAATYYDVTLELWVIDASDDVKQLPLSRRSCFLNSDAVNFTSYQSCISDYIMKEIAEECVCLPFDYQPGSSEEEYSRCHWDRMPCVYSTLDRVRGEIRRILGQRACYPRCEYAQYDTKAEYTVPQRSKGVKARNPAHRQLSRVSVHYANNICIKYRREVLYTWDQMLANLGGIFGLCLGGSIISIIEIIWFVVDLVIAVFTQLRKTTKQKKKIAISDAWIKSQRKISVAPKYPFVN